MRTIWGPGPCEVGLMVSLSLYLEVENSLQPPNIRISALKYIYFLIKLYI